MFVYFERETLQVTHVVTSHDLTYDPKSNGELFIRTTKDIAPERLMLTSSLAGDGFTAIKQDGADWTVIAVAEKRDMSVTGPRQIKLGEIAHFVGVPDKVTVAVNGVVHGEMDEGGHLEFTPETTGFFEIVFSLAGYMDWSTTLEVVRPE